VLQASAVVGIVVVTVLAMRLFGPRQTVAQSAQQGDVRATAFTLVGADGTVLAKLAPGTQGNGNLTVFDSTGRPRAGLQGNGVVAILDTDGKPRTLLNYNADGPGAGSGGVVALDATGKPRAVLTYNQNSEVGGTLAFDSTGTARAGVGYNAAVGTPFVSLFGESGPGSGACPARATRHLRTDASYGFDVCDADGNVIYTAP
jgi:hypothetical protein